MADEARAIVPRLRRHPSLAIWCGGNELDGDDSTPVLARAARRRARARPGRGRGCRPRRSGDADVHGPWEHQGLRAHYEHYDTRTSLLHSEFGVEGMTNRRALEALIAPEHRWPADRTNPVYEHLGAWWNNAPLVQEAFGGRIDGRRDDAPRVASGSSTRACATRSRRRCGAAQRHDPVAAQRVVPERVVHVRRRLPRRPEARVLGRRARVRGRAASARFATCAWGGRGEARRAGDGAGALRRPRRHGRRRGDGGELAAPLDAFARDVFLLDLGARNRYVMTRTENLAPLLDLPRARSNVALDGSSSAPQRRARRGARDRARGRAARRRAGLGRVLRQRARPAAGRGARDRVGGPVGRAARGGLECPRGLVRRPRADGSPVDGFRFDGALTVTLRGRASRSTRASASSSSCRRPTTRDWLVPGVFYGENRPEAARGSTRASRPGRVDVARMESDAWSFRADRCATPAVFARGGGLVTTRGEPARAGRRRLRAPRRPAVDLARLPLPRGAAPLRRLRDAGAAGRADLPLAAGRARRARRSSTATATGARRSATPRPRRDPRPGSPSRRRRRSPRTACTAGTTGPTRRA